MQVTCERDKLLSAFQTASAVAPARSPKPILQNVKLEVQDGVAYLLATDLEIGIRMEVAGVEVSRPGSVVLPVQRFGSILRESNDAKLSLDYDGQGTQVQGERSRFRLPADNPDDFPPVSAFQEALYHEVPARLLREMIRRTVFATDNESTRYALGGVLLELAADKIIAVGTDGRRLATMEGPARVVGPAEGPDQLPIVPAKAMHVIERALGDMSTEVLLSAKANSILVKCERTTVYSRLVEGRFPKWRDVFPRREGSVRIEIPVGPLHTAVRQAAIVTSEESRGVDFRFEQGMLSLTGQSADLGKSQIELPIAYDGPAVTITLDPRYFSDFLKVLDAGTTFQLDIKDAESAAVCSTSDGYSYVIMPLARDQDRRTA